EKKKKKEGGSTTTMNWFSWRKPSMIYCKSEPSEVHNPEAASKSKKKKKQQQQQLLSSVLTKKSGGGGGGGGGGRSGCSRSIANLKDVVIHGSKRHLQVERPPSCSPRSIGSSEFLNPITHEVILSNNSRCELKITGCHEALRTSSAGGSAAAFVGTLRPGTPGPGPAPPRRGGKEGTVPPAVTTKRPSVENGAVLLLPCQRCGESFSKWEALERHHVASHAVTELAEGDSSRKIVEIICRSSWPKSEQPRRCVRIERVLKVHNMQRTVGRFEEYREAVKAKAGKLAKKHPRCLADGNELLRFYGTTVACSLGLNGSSSLCAADKCSVCRIIKDGFCSKREISGGGGGGIGVFTTSSSETALESIDECPGTRKALIVCRVIAGRVHRPLENIQEIAGQIGFDSLAGKVGLYSNIEELYLLNPKALLPCFVIVCR
ncbi:hypothetical protein M569_05170, partial [Genlisea aurea]